MIFLYIMLIVMSVLWHHNGFMVPLAQSSRLYNLNQISYEEFRGFVPQDKITECSPGPLPTVRPALLLFSQAPVK